jgi:hypothetical protein
MCVVGLGMRTLQQPLGSMHLRSNLSRTTSVRTLSTSTTLNTSTTLLPHANLDANLRKSQDLSSIEARARLTPN